MTSKEHPSFDEIHRTVMRVKPLIGELSDAITYVGGTLLGERGDDRELDVIDTSARLALNLYEKVFHGNKAGQETVMRRHFEDGDEPSFIDLRQGTAPGFHLYTLLSSSLISIPIVLSNREITEPLTPKGLIGLSVLSKLPSDTEKRKKVRAKAKELILDDPVAQELFNRNTGLFNGHFPNITTGGITEQIFRD